MKRFLQCVTLIFVSVLLTTVVWHHQRDPVTNNALTVDKRNPIKATATSSVVTTRPTPNLRIQELITTNATHTIQILEKQRVEPENLHKIPVETQHKTAFLEGSVTKNNARYAYVTIMHGIDETGGYKGYLYNLLTIRSRLSKLGSNADLIAMIGFTKATQVTLEMKMDLKLLEKHGIILYYLPRLRDEKQYPKVNFMEMALLKITPWKFTEYKAIQFMDADVLPHHNMDCLFKLKRNSFNTGSASPLNSGWYLSRPNLEDYNKLVELAKMRMSKKWDEVKGWGSPIPSEALYFRGMNKAVTSWNFNGASLDQGLLTHYFVLHNGRVQLFDAKVGYEFDENFSRRPIELNDVLKECGVSSPMDMFYHYTGRNKPWLRIQSQQKDRALQYWMKSFDELGLNITAASLEGEHLKPSLGYFHPNK